MSCREIEMRGSQQQFVTLCGASAARRDSLVRSTREVDPSAHNAFLHASKEAPEGASLEVREPVSTTNRSRCCTFRYALSNLNDAERWKLIYGSNGHAP